MLTTSLSLLERLRLPGEQQAWDRTSAIIAMVLDSA